ncbi:PLP-dependent aminotransferase family protein [Brevibacterium sp. 2SA]|uniref:MocR-like transcription factor YczR n=1 Tax=Brevibacterium sp. 2SA TaxID=2502198 RepID=UPI002016D224|nr:PLP-dependent aminotransferase family protein [Brevibacterium sp. 2SA]
MTTAMGARRLARIIGTGPFAPPAYESLAGAIAHAISDGRIPVGVRLPSERELATALDLSRTTSSRAYARLRELGFVRTRRGSGSLVELPEVPGGRIDHLLSPTEPTAGSIDLTCTATVAPLGLVDAYERAVSQVHAYLPGTGYYPSGIPALRELVAARYTQRGLPTRPDDILITSGALGGAAIGIRALLGGSGGVLVESPSYPNAIATIEGAGARIVAYPLEVDDDGRHRWDVRAMGQTMRENRVRAAYLIPDFHNPTGALLPDADRAALAAELGRSAVVPVVDESLVELGLDGTPGQTPLSVFAPDSIAVGSTSKIFWGGLRVGWMRVPAARMEEAAAVRLTLDLGAPVLEQLVAVELLRNHDELVAQMRARLAAARDRLVADVRTHLPSWQVAVPDGGMALWARLPEERSGALVSAARAHGVTLASGPNFAPIGGLDRWIRLPYTVAEAELAEVAPRLAAAWEDALQMPGPIPDERARIVA